jgi:peptidyl-prolyl cis-trans isomerase C
MNIKFLTTMLISFLLLVACQPQDQQEKKAKIDKADAVAVVDGNYISKSALEILKKEVSQRMPGQKFPEKQLIEELIKREILVQDALKKKLDQTPEITQSLESFKQSLLSQAALQDYFKNNEITDAELKAEYDKQAAPGGNTEYKASHILLKTEAEAKDVITKLNDGGDFTKLAKELSTGPSGPKGGNLGWFAPKQMVPPFSEAVIALENTKYTTEPVKTNFGWHVILREDSRQQSAPDFESVKDQLRPMLQRQKMQDYLNQLREQAKIEIFEPEAVIPEPTTDAEAVGAESNKNEPAEPVVQTQTDTKSEEGLSVPVEGAAEISHGHGTNTGEITEQTEAVEEQLSSEKEQAAVK